MSSFLTCVQFESSWKKKSESERKQLRQTRDELISEAKDEYEKAERKKEAAKRRGEDTWMLPEIHGRLKEEKDSLKVKKKKKKDKKEKKEKKKKKKKSKSSDLSNGSESEESDEWVEKAKASPTVKGPQPQRDSWMLESHDVLPCISQSEIRSKREQDKEKAREERSTIDQLGQSERELNPYWKDGGTGLPDEQTKPATGGGHVADGGVGWWRRARARCEQEAATTGLTLRQVAADRYGSLEALDERIMAAEDGARGRDAGRQEDQEDRRGRAPDGDTRPYDRWKDQQGHASARKEDERVGSNKSCTFRKPRTSDDEGEDALSYSRVRDRREHNLRKHRDDRQRRDRDEGRDGGRVDGWRKADHSHERNHRDNGDQTASTAFRKSRTSDDDGDGPSTHSRHQSSHTRDANRSPTRSQRPRAVETNILERFRKPDGESDDSDENSRPERDSSKRDESQNLRQSLKKQITEEECKIDGKRSAPKNCESCDKVNRRDYKEQDRQSSSSSHSGSSGEEDIASDRTRVENAPPEETPQPAPAKEVAILSDAEMNKLGAKILKAEILGNTSRAAQLTAKLEAARAATTEAKAAGALPQQGAPQGMTEAEEVVLTRADRAGVVWPVEHAQPATSGSRRKKRKMATHDCDGKRERYFADDDRHDLTALVRREKTSTAEDGDAMFARLAGRAVEMTDDDHQIDDVFVNRANKHSDFMEEGRQRVQAMNEHKKLNTALGKCIRCIEKTAKHLIIALGVKVYLCVPPHRSLSEAQCWIVPTAHAAAGTALDEDVWAEIKLFMKGVSAVCAARGEVAVFLETATHLKHQPHAYIECVPILQDEAALAPAYFKKAIQEVGPEWAQNKKLVELAGKDVRAAIPKGFPYFSIMMDGCPGYATVIEDERSFLPWFGREICGGMMDCDPTLWRKPQKESFNDQRQKSLNFSKLWKPYNWTLRLKKAESSSSESDS